MALQLYNTLTRKREPFVPADPRRVTMYVCGMTVYSFAHIGNARPVVVFDVLARLLRRSYPLVYVRNFTDVDDRINAAAAGEGVSIGELAERYIGHYRDDMGALGALPPDIEPRVTAHLPAIVDFIERLIRSGHAYTADRHVLFSVPSYPRYGQLSGRNRDEMIAGARVEVAPYKRDPADFVLWKPSADDEVGWDSPWGRGRPGWHIECSTMAEAHLGPTIDIHGGGLDLVFPHHENEIAQSTCAHENALFSRYWVHNGLVHMDSAKMSKSVGNVLLVRDLLREYDGEVLRLGLLTAHYRQPLDWTEQLLVEARQKLDRMYGALREAGVTGAISSPPATKLPTPVVAALEDDLNTPQALTELLALARAANRSKEPAEKRSLAESLRSGAWFVGLLERDPEDWFSHLSTHRDAASPSEAEIEALVERREALRRQREYAAADDIRDELARLGIVVEDVAQGSRWRRSR